MGNATNIWELAFRFIQGLGGGALLVTAQTIITESYPIAKEDGTSHLRNGCDCRAYIRSTIRRVYCRSFFLIFFYINIPLGIMPLFDKLCRSPKYGEKLKSNQVDWMGIILLASFSLQFVLEHGQQDDWFNNKLIVLLSRFRIWINTVHLATVNL
jgi:DHA2 family multidrug resistance protein